MFCFRQAHPPQLAHLKEKRVRICVLSLTRNREKPSTKEIVIIQGRNSALCCKLKHYVRIDHCIMRQSSPVMNYVSVRVFGQSRSVSSLIACEIHRDCLTSSFPSFRRPWHRFSSRYRRRCVRYSQQHSQKNPGGSP
jgi:hypothetical protein